jgi:cytochrome c
MRNVLMAGVLAGALAMTGTALAQDGAKLAEAAGCGTCHALDRKKMGPTYRAIAASHKKGKVTLDQAIAKLKKTHDPADLKDVKSDADLRAIMTWIMAQ